MRTPWTGLALLGAIALAPVGFVFCTPKAAPEPAVPEPSTPASATSAVTAPATTPDPQPETEPAPPKPSAPPATLRSTKGMSCAALDKAIDHDLETRSCTTDGDCTAGNRACSCSVPLSTNAKAQLDADSAAYRARGCDRVGPPRPCASCPMPPEVMCAGGTCTARR